MESKTGNQLLLERRLQSREFDPAEFRNLGRLTRRIEEASGLACYLEWTPEGTVSRYFDGLQARVDLGKSSFHNGQAYLSVEQLEQLAALPPETVASDYAENLTGRHFRTIDTYRDVRFPQEPVAPPADAGPPPGQKAPRTYNSLVKAKVFAATGVLALAATLGAAVKLNSAEKPATVATAPDPYRTVDYYPPAENGSYQPPAAVNPDGGDTLVRASFAAESPSGPVEFDFGELLLLEMAPPPAAAEVPAAREEPAADVPATSEEPVVDIPAVPEEPLQTAAEPSEREETLPQETPVVEAVPDTPAETLPESVPTSQVRVVVNQQAVELQLGDAEPVRESQPAQSTRPAERPRPTTTTTPKASEPAATPAPVATLTAEQRGWLVAAGIPETVWGYVDYIFTGESHWRPYLWSSVDVKSYGLCQANLLVHEVPDGYMDDPVVQVRWCDEYAHKRYGGWKNAYEAWQRKRWW